MRVVIQPGANGSNGARLDAGNWLDLIEAYLRYRYSSFGLGGRQGPVEASGPVYPHLSGWYLYMYAEAQGGGHDIVDLDYIQVLGTESATLWVQDTDGTWWSDGPLPPNTPPYYTDVSSFGYSIQNAAITNADGGGPVSIGGFYFATFSG